jgi:two-component sensor histidine kinase
MLVEITERKQGERQKALLIDELSHHAKNTLAIVQSIASQTLRQTPDPKLFGPAFSERRDALARAHRLLTETEWRGAPLDHLIADAPARKQKEEQHMKRTVGALIALSLSAGAANAKVFDEFRDPRLALTRSGEVGIADDKVRQALPRIGSEDFGQSLPCSAVHSGTASAKL